MDLTTATQKVQEKLQAAAGSLDATVKFVLGNDGVVFLNGNTNEVSNEDQDAQCTVMMEMADFHSMMDGDLNPMSAFMGGQMKIEGDMSVAMKLSSIFG
ncbi:MAG: SCP2 sterol-binding domain-containing protein [Microscillaceae bacterium]